MQRLAIILIVVFVSTAASGCASYSDERLDSARFAIDKSNWTEAINDAEAVLSRDSSNVEAALLLSAGYAGRGGIGVLGIGADIAESDSADNEFKVAHEALLDPYTIRRIG